MKTIKDLINLNGRRALITGATGNLGIVISETLAELGANLILVDKPDSNINELLKSLKNRFDIEIDYQECDLESPIERLELINFVKSSFKEVNILINNAAFVGTSNLQGWGVPFEEQSIDTWRRAIEVNLTAPFDLCQKLLSNLSNSEGASIINIASIYGQYGPDWSLYADTKMSNPAAYAASKGGLIQFTRWLSTTLAPKVRVNAISPGGIFRNQPDVFVEKYHARTPLKRMASEEDFKGAIAFLSSDMSNYVTGQIMQIDGGWGVW